MISRGCCSLIWLVYISKLLCKIISFLDKGVQTWFLIDYDRELYQINNFRYSSSFLMNLLSAEEMRQVELTFIKLSAKAKYVLKVPEKTQYQNINFFESSIFPVASLESQKLIKRSLTLTDKTIGLQFQTPNSLYHMLTYVLMSILYRDNCKNVGGSDVETINYLLETIKCSLYSQDVELKLIKNVEVKFDTLEMKLLICKFFVFMENQCLKLTTNRVNCVKWIFDHNPMLLLGLNLFLRCILSKLGTEGSDDYRKFGNVQQSVTNIIQYFDINYRNFGELFLFYEQGLFLALTERQIMFGQYYQNEQEKQNQKQQNQIKSSVKLNMIQSFLVSVEEKPNNNLINKKKGIVDSDVKLFNFLLESKSDDTLSDGIMHKEKDLDMETPHFKDSCETFHFGKKKKQVDFKPEQVRNQFQKLIMDDSDAQVNEFGQNQAPTPFLGGAIQDFNDFTRFSQQKHNRQAQKLDSPIDELMNMPDIKIGSPKSQSKNYVVHSSFRKTIQQKDKSISVFTPQSEKQCKQSSFSLFEKQCNFIGSFSNEKNNRNDNQNEMVCCKCRQIKIKKNALAFKVVEFLFVPPQRKYIQQLKTLTSPRYSNVRSYNDWKAVQEISKNNNDKPKEFAQKTEQYTNIRKPSFLKNLKKNKDTTVQTEKFAHSAVGHFGSKNKSGITKQTSQEQRQFKKYSTIMDKRETNNVDYGYNSPKQLDSKSTKAVSDVGQVAKGNQKELFRNDLPNQVWQTTSNFHQKMPQYVQLNQIKTSHLSNQNSPICKQGYGKFNTPVQSMGSGINVSLNSHISSNLVYKLNQYCNEVNRTVNPEINRNENVQIRSPVDKNGQKSLRKMMPMTKSSDKIGPYFRKQF